MTLILPKPNVASHADLLDLIRLALPGATVEVAEAPKRFDFVAELRRGHNR